MNIAPWVEWFTEKFINDGGGTKQDLPLMDRSILSQGLQGESMNYLVTYECRTGTDVFVGEFEFESTEEPKISDQSIIDKARQDSVKFHTSGAAGLSIKSISLCLER